MGLVSSAAVTPDRAEPLREIRVLRRFRYPQVKNLYVEQEALHPFGECLVLDCDFCDSKSSAKMFVTLNALPSLSQVEGVWLTKH